MTGELRLEAAIRCTRCSHSTTCCELEPQKSNIHVLSVCRTRSITYYPSKEWSVYIPTSLLCAFVAFLFLNAAMNVMITPKLDSLDTMWDEHSRPHRANDASSVASE